MVLNPSHKSENHGMGWGRKTERNGDMGRGEEKGKMGRKRIRQGRREEEREQGREVRREGGKWKKIRKTKK